MKTTKKFLSMLLSLVMALVLAVPAFASEGTTVNYTIKAPSNGHTYEVYQIFTGDLADGVLSNVKWGKNGTETAGTAVSDTIIEALTAVNNKTDAEKLAVIEQYVDLTGDAFGTVSNGSTLSAPAGYYLIKDKDGTVSGQDSYTTYIVEVVGNVTITPKASVPSFEKKVIDTNDTTGETSNWQDSADHDIGDTVNFKLEGTVAANYAAYKTYYFAFHDQQSAGLTFNPESVVVKVDGETITNPADGTPYYTVVTSPTDGCTFEVVFANLKNIETVRAGSVITVEYTATLNENAVIGEKGNPNEAKLEFSNNPNQEQVGEGKPETGETPWDKVIVFTYKVVINKVDGENKPLTGAAFKLEKLQNGKWTTVKEFTVDGTTTFEFTGLDDGTYRLTETETPAGYNSIDPIEFTVTADHEITSDDPSLISLSGNAATGEITFTPDVTAGSLTSSVENKSGATLPETGGMGTTLFYVIGSILVLGAGVLLVTKKRMSK